MEQQQILTFSEDDFEKLFNDIPESTVTADNIVGGKIVKEENESAENNKKEEVKPKIDLFDEKTLESIFNEFDDEDEEKDTKKQTKSKEEAKPVIENTVEDNEDEDDYYKNMVDYLIEKNIFSDFEGREEFEYTDENFAKLLEEQTNLKSKEAFDSLVESTGTIGKAIIDYVQKGGDPDEIIDLFKEQKRIDKIELKSEDDKVNFVKEYYTKVLNFKEGKAQKLIDAFILDDELDSEVEEVKEKYKLKYSEDAANLQKQQDQYIEEQARAERAFAENITKSLQSRSDLTDKEKSKLAESILYYNESLPDGAKVNKFYLKFAEVQQDMNSYLDLVQFVMDKDKYLEKIKKQVSNEETNKAWTLIKRNNSTSSKSGSNQLSRKKAQSDVQDFKFM